MTPREIRQRIRAGEITGHTSGLASGCVQGNVAILPQALAPEELIGGNGLIELGTFLAIVLGAAAGGFLYAAFKPNHWQSGLLLVVLAGLGLATSFGISRISAAAPTRRSSRSSAMNYDSSLAPC